MFAPFFIGMYLNRLNKSYVLHAGITLNVFSILVLFSVQSTLEVALYRTLAGVAHALFWQSSEVLTIMPSSSLLQQL